MKACLAMDDSVLLKMIGVTISMLISGRFDHRIHLFHRGCCKYLYFKLYKSVFYSKYNYSKGIKHSYYYPYRTIREESSLATVSLSPDNNYKSTFLIIR